MTRVVLDTNILVSALLQSLGPSAQLFVRCLNGSLQLCLTGAIYAEYEEVISRPRLGRNPDVIAGTLKAIREIGLWVKPTACVTVCSDPDDDVFLECAQVRMPVILLPATSSIFRHPGPAPGSLRRAGCWMRLRVGQLDNENLLCPNFDQQH
jgi:putative PIN family toxin of toxin-antitoxin system